MAGQHDDVSDEATTGCRIDLAPVGWLVREAMVTAPAVSGWPLSLAGKTA